MSKINILLIPADTYGIGNFRFIEPHIEIQKQFGDEFYVDINMNPDWDDKAYLDKFQIIFGSKNMLHVSKARELFPKLQAEGKIIIMDIDDHWELSPKNPQYQLAKEIKHAESTIEYFKLVDYVTTTTEFFAKEIRKYIKNVLVFPNAIDPTSKKYQIINEISNKIRFGILTGSSHFEDLKLLQPMFSSILTKYPEKVQSVLCGFDIRGKVKDRDAHGNTFERPIKVEETPWYFYEKIITADYKNISPEYKEWLLKYKKENFDDKNLPYRRIWTKPISTYSLNYNLMDVSIAPLVNDKFNSVKSNLKVIEAGFFKKPIIASDISPYQIDIKNGENGFLVKEGSNKDWSYYAKKFIDNPELIKNMGEKLYETVKDKYDLRNVSRNRAEFYKSILK